MKYTLFNDFGTYITISKKKLKIVGFSKFLYGQLSIHILLVVIKLKNGKF